MKFSFSHFLFLFLIFPLSLISISSHGQSVEEAPCFYGILAEGECNPEPEDFSARSLETTEELSFNYSIDRSKEDEPCLCGISPEEAGACLDSCDALDEMEKESEERHFEAVSLEKEDVCLYGILRPGECRNNPESLR